MTLKIEFHARIRVNESNNTYVMRYYDFSGIGFNSKDGDRIHFINLYPEEEVVKETNDADILREIIENMKKEKEKQEENPD